MKKRLISALVAGLALSAAAVAPAQAATINVNLAGLSAASGTAIVQFSMYSHGTLYGTNNCATATACDGIANASAYNGTGAGAGNLEDSWGIFSITGITVTSPDLATTWKWSPGAGGFLSGMYYGIVDTSSTYSTSSTASVKTEAQVNTAVGGKVDVYQLASNTSFSITTPTTDRNGQDDFFINAAHTQSLQNQGALWLSGDFDSYGAKFTTKTTLTGTNAGSIATVGEPSIYIDLIAGSVLSQWDTNLVNTNPNNINATNDMGGSSTFNCQFNATAGTYSCGTIWTTKGVASLDGNKIPEPGSIALIGLGLMGLAGLRRRMQKA